MCCSSITTVSADGYICAAHLLILYLLEDISVNTVSAGEGTGRRNACCLIYCLPNQATTLLYIILVHTSAYVPGLYVLCVYTYMRRRWSTNLKKKPL